MKTKYVYFTFSLLVLLVTTKAGNLFMEPSNSINIQERLMNTPPQAQDNFVTTSGDGPTTVLIPVTANDSDAEDGTLDPCNVTIVAAPSIGTASIGNAPDCIISYTPELCNSGMDTFVYQVCDSGGACATATVFIQITSSNDPPITNDDYHNTLINESVNIDFAANDTVYYICQAPLSTCDAYFSSPTHGTVTLGASPDCTFTYTPAQDYIGSDSFEYQICTSYGSCEYATVYIDVISPQIMVDARLFLEGPFSSNDLLMSDDLRQQGLIPLDEPYTALGYDRSSSGQESIFSQLLETSGSEAITDWILIEIRDSDDPSLLITTQAALLRRDGQIIDTEGNYPIEIALTTPNVQSYFVALRHRNHLSTISPSPCPRGTTFTLDFSTLDIPGQVALSGNTNSFGLASGEVTRNDAIAAPDRSTVWNARNTSGYLTEDVNLDGLVDAADRSVVWGNRNRSVYIPD